MALKLSAEAQLVFFNKVFGPNSAVATMAKALVDTGKVSFETTLYEVKANVIGKTVSPVVLSCGVSALMKNSVPEAVAVQNKNLIVDWMSSLFILMGSPTKKAPVAESHEPTSKGVQVVLTGVVDSAKKLSTIKAVMNLTGKSLAYAKTCVDKAMSTGHALVNVYPTMAAAEQATKVLVAAGGAVMVETPEATQTHTPHGLWAGGASDTFTKASGPLSPEWTAVHPIKPVDKVIDLRDAKALGQKVHGTSHGSVYYCIAFNDHLKVAARIYKTGSISIRTEWQGQPNALKADLKKLEESGVQLKGDYGSVHFDAAGVPVSRVIGAFLIGTGIAWTAMVTNGQDLILTEKIA